MTREEAIDYNKNLRMYMRLSDKNQPCKFLEENYIALDMAIKALEQEPCETQMIDKSNFSQEQYKADLQCAYDCGKASVKTCEDAISRQAVLKTLDDMDNILDEDRTIENYKELLKECYEVLPPVTPQPKTGHWIRVDKDKLRCSKCDVIHFIGQYPQGKIAWCPNCGAKMESENKK